MGGTTFVNLVWWGIGGAAVLVGLLQVALALGGPRARRGTAVIGVLVVMLGGLAFAMPFFGAGGAPPGRPRPGTDGAGSAAGLTPWSGVAFENLLQALPRESRTLDALVAEIISRLDAGTVTDEALAALVQRCASGDAQARPPAPAWQAKYGRLLGAMYAIHAESGRALDARSLATLLDLPPTYRLTTRERWPEGLDPVVRVSMAHFWPPGYGLRLEVVPHLEHGLSSAFAGDRDWMLVQAGLAPGRHEIAIDVNVQRVPPMTARGAVNPPVVVAQDVVTLRVEVGGTAEQVLPPVSMTSMDAAMRDGLAFRLRPGVRGFEIRVDTSATRAPMFDGVGVGAWLDILRDGAVVCSVPCWWQAGTIGADDDPLRVPVQRGEAAALSRTGDAPLQVRLRPNPEYGLRAARATRHWSGELTFPLPREGG